MPAGRHRPPHCTRTGRAWRGVVKFFIHTSFRPFTYLGRLLVAPCGQAGVSAQDSSMILSPPISHDQKSLRPWPYPNRLSTPPPGSTSGLLDKTSSCIGPKMVICRNETTPTNSHRLSRGAAQRLRRRISDSNQGAASSCIMLSVPWTTRQSAWFGTPLDRYRPVESLQRVRHEVDSACIELLN
ncbi:uncharacterized protein B0T15DRAFT_268270 [Chaetomium strumarium]|uniref:Uncharacterized protein n=1 Tax=Chaetomium strumarium TaxID=1170767 RepID=A0AAJ0LZC9_9PEZI|nr:hypothetical protein B0T15DRAFT_268270 [Chaetomium strumarium]